MFRETSSQRGLFEPELQLNDRGRRRLKRSWAEKFSQRVLPVLLEAEKDFADLYDEKTGRPSWSVARMLGLVLLRELHALGSDQATVDALAFDVRWQHALGVRGEDEAHLSKRSLVDFRMRLHQVDRDSHRVKALFEKLGEAAIKDLGVCTEVQRIDSTFIKSNIARRGRRALLSETLKRLMSAAEETSSWEQVPLAARRWYENATGWGRSPKMAEVLSWLDATLRALAETPIATDVAYLQARKVLDEHSELPEPPDSDEPPDDEPDKAGRPRTKSSRGAQVRKKSKKKNASKSTKRSRRKAKGHERQLRKKSSPNSIQSLHDEDAKRGYKGVGYLVQVVETCGNTGTEILTAVDVQAANASDQKAVEPLVTELEARELKPKVLLADAGYTSGHNILSAEADGMELRGPVPKVRADDLLNRSDFEFSQEGQIISCPRGQTPLSHSTRGSSSTGKPSLHAMFDRSVCGKCESKEACPVRIPKEGRRAHIAIAPELRRRDARQREQRDPNWRASYKLRSGIEATNSELKRAHLLGRMTVRTLPKVRRRAFLKASACNIKRWCREATRTEEGAGPARKGSGPSAVVIPFRTATTLHRTQLSYSSTTIDLRPSYHGPLPMTAAA